MKILDPSGLKYEERFEVWAQREGEEHWKKEVKLHKSREEAWAEVDTLRNQSDVTRSMGWRVYFTKVATNRIEV